MSCLAVLTTSIACQPLMQLDAIEHVVVHFAGGYQDDDEDVDEEEW